MKIDEIYYSPYVTGSVPLPSAVWLFGAGLIGLTGVRKKMKKRGR